MDHNSFVRTALLLSVCVLGLARAASVPSYKVDPFWPKPLPNNWIIGSIGGITVDSSDHVWILQRPRSLTPEEAGAVQNPPLSTCCVPAPAVIEFDAQGNVVQAWGGPGAGYDWPENEHGIHVDAKGFVWTAGNGEKDGVLLKFTRNGKFVMQIGGIGPSKGSNDSTILGGPADFTVDTQANEIYIADGYHNRRVIVFDTETGAYKRHWGAYGNKPIDGPVTYNPQGPLPQQFNEPVHCVKLSKDGFVHVCDRRNDRIQVFRKDGTFVRELRVAPATLGNGTAGDAVPWPKGDQPYLVVANSEQRTVDILDRKTGQVVGSFGRGGRWAGQFYQLHDLAVDSHGNVFTGEIGGKRVQKLKVQ